MSPIARFVTFRPRPGAGDALAEQLLRTAELIADVPGCEQWLVAQDADAVRVSERWSAAAHAEAALQEPPLVENAERIMTLLVEPPVVIESRLLGGARELRGTTGATHFSILDAPDLSQDAALLGKYDLRSVAQARYVRRELEAIQVGLTHYRLGPGRRLGWAHRHGTVEEIYVALGGEGRIKVDDQLLTLRPLDAVRVAPGSTRELEAGADGLEVLAFGAHVPGDGEMVADWWPA